MCAMADFAYSLKGKGLPVTWVYMVSCVYNQIGELIG